MNRSLHIQLQSSDNFELQKFHLEVIFAKPQKKHYYMVRNISSLIRERSFQYIINISLTINCCVVRGRIKGAES